MNGVLRSRSWWSHADRRKKDSNRPFCIPRIPSRQTNQWRLRPSSAFVDYLGTHFKKFFLFRVQSGWKKVHAEIWGWFGDVSGDPRDENFSRLALLARGKVKLCKMLLHDRTTRGKVLLKVWTCLLCWETFMTSKVNKSSSQAWVTNSFEDFPHKASHFTFKPVLSHPNMQPFSLSHCVSTSTRRNNRKFCRQPRSAQNPQKNKNSQNQIYWGV